MSAHHGATVAAAATAMTQRRHDAPHRYEHVHRHVQLETSRTRRQGLLSWRTAFVVTASVVIGACLVRITADTDALTRGSRHNELFQQDADQQDWLERDWVVGSLMQGIQQPQHDNESTADNVLDSVTHMNKRPAWQVWVQDGIDSLGSAINLALGLDDDGVDVHDMSLRDSPGGTGLSTWAESSVYVQRTRSLYPSRPSAFGPHILHEPLSSFLYPITTFAPSDSYGCASPRQGDNHTVTALPKPAKTGWIALVQRGHCAFSQKVRYAQDRGAVAVVFGDQSVEDGGISGVGGLLTPWSPDDTSDVRIPSSFVSRSSYLSLLDTWDSVQDELSSSGRSSHPVGLFVVLSKDEFFAWPLVDLLLLVLFLPSLLTLLTVFGQRLRVIRQQRRDRAPREAVAKLPVFTWGDVQKESTTLASPAVASARDAEVVGRGDEESNVGSSDERTPLLQTRSSPARGESETDTVAADPGWLPRRFQRLLHMHRDSKSQVVLAPRRERRYDLSTECAICLSEFESGDRVMELPCGHLFHEAEITPWLIDTKRLCPICRASITVDSPEPETASGSARSSDASAGGLTDAGPVALPLRASTSGSPEVASSAPAALARSR
ncbi:hypothetical protein OIV83_003932 [Microbotryomycetes sp. JL201]|nr:hypothetical protein OIV83_003932 [Microbotryomycetes sp. JL201]